MAEIYYTPKEYEAAFSKPWGDRDAVYFVDYADTNDVTVSHRFWRVGTLEEQKEYTEDINSGEILCATTHCPANDYFHNAEKKNVKKNYRIEIEGCHDSTKFTIELDEKEYEFMEKFSRLVNEAATYSCMPTLSISEGEK